MKIGNARRRIRSPLVLLFDCLLALYPPRFRSEFVSEIRAVIFSRLGDASEYSGAARLLAVLREISGLAVSILHEQRHEIRVRKEQAMTQEGSHPRETGAASGGMPPVLLAGGSGVWWLAGWTLLTTASIPAALIIVAPLAVLLMELINLGVRAGLWPAASAASLQGIGAVCGLALALSTAQWLLLRKLLPNAGQWFLATGAGVALGGIMVGMLIGIISGQGWEDVWLMAAVLLPIGMALGLAHWLYLRRVLPNAHWIVLIDVLAAASILLAGAVFTSLAELLVFALPGVITGLGLLLLLRQSRATMPPPLLEKANRNAWTRLPRFSRIAIGTAALVILFFAGSWAYATSQLALAKQAGIYATPNEAVIAKSSQGWGGASMVRLEDVWAEPNRRDAQSHVWFGGATVYLDRVPQGYHKLQFSTGSYYLHVREGWVHVPEGAFPEFIGWVMELYNLEGVRQ